MRNIEKLSADTQKLLLSKLQSPTNVNLIAVYFAKQMSSCQLFPMLVDLLGEEMFMNLLMVMASEHLYFPSMTTLMEAKMVLAVYEEIEECAQELKKVRIKELSKKYKLDVDRLYKRVSELLDRPRNTPEDVHTGKESSNRGI